MLQPTTNLAGEGAVTGIEVFTYPLIADSPIPSWELFRGVDCTGREPVHGTECGETGPCGSAEKAVAREARHEEEVGRSFETGREQGFQQGRAAEREALAASLKAKDAGRMEQATRLVESFEAEQTRYFEAVEREVVRLALAVAARILRREAQMDPLLLMGAVRVALGQLSNSTQVRLRVPAAELDLWTESMALVPGLGVKPVVIAGEEMRLGDCVMETDLGTVDLGVRAQLSEIERGFFDRAGGHAAADPTAANDVFRETRR